MVSDRGTVLSVNVGGVRPFDYNGRQAVSAIWKTPVAGRVVAQGVNLAGDDQADREAHGGPDKAVYAYAIEDTKWWESELGSELEPGQFGENLTVKGLDVTNALVGERWEIGTTVLEVSEPRVPCWRLGVRMEDSRFIRRFTEAGRPGSYLRIINEGELGSGDKICVVERPDHDLTIGDVFRIYAGARGEAGRILSTPQMSTAWQQWAEGVMKKKKGTEESPGPGCCNDS